MIISNDLIGKKHEKLDSLECAKWLPLSVFLLPVCIARPHSVACGGGGGWPQIIRQYRNSGTLYAILTLRFEMTVISRKEYLVGIKDISISYVVSTLRGAKFM